MSVLAFFALYIFCYAALTLGLSLSGLDFISSHAQEMSSEIMYKHIELYVNKFSVELGPEGRKAVEVFFKEALKLGIIPVTKQNLFL